MKPSDILYENGDFWVCRAGKWFEVYRSGVTHSTRVATIGYEGQAGLDRAKSEADKRAAAISPAHRNTPTE
jgi:hypothetical protein